MESPPKILQDRLASVEARIVSACARAGRPRQAVTLVAVTKTVGSDVARILVDLGVRDLAENRPQELWKKAAAIPQARWHLIGHLQRNKIEQTLPLVQRIHSVDSLRLLTALNTEAGRRGVRVPVLLEFNASGEASKHGFVPGEATVESLATALANLPAVSVRGLMTMAAYTDDPKQTRPTFAGLRALQDVLRQQCDTERHPLDELSMGMSNDFEVAIEEGATWIRLGTVLFEGLE